MDKLQFYSSVKVILNHISDAAYLENHNIIGLLLSEEEARQANRLQILRNKISEAINVLRPPEDIPANATEWRCFRILTLRYLQLKEWHHIEYDLGLSQRQVQRDLKKGLDALISMLWERFLTETHEGLPDGASTEIAASQDLELIKEELKNWELTFELLNLSLLIQQAMQLTESLLKTNLQGRIDLGAVDQKISVMLDQVLTRQGLYMILSMVGPEAQGVSISLRTTKLNEHFIEFSLQYQYSQPISLKNWQTAQLFFTIQGLNHSISEQPGQTTIAIILPRMQQNSCLVIDDVVDVRRLVERMLGSYGIQVFGADNLPDALSLAQLVKPDFILLDVLMPKMDGWQIIHNLKAHPDTSDIPVIICSVLPEPELSKAVGAAGYLRKPINRLELIHTLQEIGFIETGN